MKTIISLIIAASSAFLLFGQNTKSMLPINTDFGEIVDARKYLDTPRYQYFYKATVGIVEWQRSADTMNYVLNLLGETLTVPQAREYKALFYRNFSKLQFSLDSIRLPEPQKPKK